MKTTIKNLILSAVLVVGGASCVDLDTAPYDRETDLTYWEEDPEAAVKALNNLLYPFGKYGRTALL